MADYTISLEIVGKDEATPAVNSTHKALLNIGRDAPGALGAVVGGLQRVAEFAVGGLLVGGIQKIGGALLELGKSAIAGNAEFERYNTQFTTMLGSADAAKQRLKDLAEFGAKTPFELPDVVKADKIIQGFGLHSIEAAKQFGFSGAEIRTIAGDVASGTGAGFEEMSLLIGKFSAGATGEALARMAELGIGSRKELADLGLEFSKSGQLLSPLPEAMNVVLTLMKKKYGGLMDAQSATFEGMMSNLSDWWGQTQRKIGEPIFNVFKENLGKLLQFLGSAEVQKALDTLANGLADGIKNAAEFIERATQKIQWLSDAIQDAGINSSEVREVLGSMFGDQFVPTIESAMNAVGAFGSWIQSVWPTVSAALQTGWIVIQDVVMAVRDVFVSDVIPSFQEAFQNITDALAELGLDWGDVWEAVKFAVVTVGKIIGAVLLFLVGSIAGFAKGFANVMKNSTQVLRDMSANFKKIIEGIAKIFAHAIEYFKALFKGDFAGAFKHAGGIVEGFADVIKGVFGQVVNIIKLTVGNVIGMISGFVDGIIKFFKNLSDRLVGNSIIPDMMSDIQKVITDTLNSISNFISSTLTTIATNFQTGFDNLLNIVSSTWTAIQNGVASAWQSITNAIKSAIEAIPDAVALAIQEVANIGSSIVNSIQSGISGAWSDVTGWIGEALSGLKDAVWDSDIFDSIMGVGKNIVYSIRSGISTLWGGIGGVIEKITELFDDFPNALKDAFGGIISTGEKIVDAIKQGIVNNWNSFVDWLKGLIGGIFGGGGSQSAPNAIPQHGYGAMAAPGVNMASSVEWHLHVSTMSPVENIVADYQTLRSIAGAG